MSDPFEAVSKRIAIYLGTFDPEASIEDIQYALAVIIHFLFITLSILTVGWLVNAFLLTLMSAAGFVLLRLSTGGLHFPSLTGCAVISIVLLSALPHIQLSTLVVHVLSVGSLGLVWLCSVKSRRAKLVATVLISANFALAMPVLSLAFACQALTLIQSRRGRHFENTHDQKNHFCFNKV